jgi:hypothetical protein
MLTHPEKSWLILFNQACAIASLLRLASSFLLAFLERFLYVHLIYGVPFR